MAVFQAYWPNLMASTIYDTVTAIAATGDKLACIGQVWHPDAATGKEISRVQFRFGTVTKAGGSGLTLSLQNVDLANTTAPFRPDGTQDQTVAIANGNAAFASNTWIRTDALSANRSVANGDWLAVVIEYDGSGRLGSDSVALAALRTALYNNQGWVRQASGTWAQVANVSPSIALECSDGTFAFLQPGTHAAISTTQRTFSSSSTPDERAQVFVPTVTMTIDGLDLTGGPNAMNADYDVVIYENGTAIHTTSIDASAQRVNGTFPQAVTLTSRVTLTAGQTYYIAIRPSTTNSVSLYEVAYNSAALAAASGWGANCGIIARTDGGSWGSVTNTSLYAMRLNVDDVSTASGSAGGTLINSQQLVRQGWM